MSGALSAVHGDERLLAFEIGTALFALPIQGVLEVAELRGRACIPTVPPQVAQGLGTMLPLPWQRGQVCAMENGPCETRIWPAPRHEGQVAGVEPGRAPLPLQVSQAAAPGMRILVSKPWAACSRVISRL